MSFTAFLEGERQHRLPVHTQVLASLRIFATGPYQKGVGQDFYHPCSQSVISKFFHVVVDALCEMSHNYIHFPQTAAEREIVQHW